MKTPEKIIVLFLFFIGTQSATKAQSTPNNPKDSAKTFEVVEVMPEYPGGKTALLEFIKKNVKYPKTAKKQHITGRVVVGFDVDKDGLLKDAHIVKSLDPECDAEALRVVRLMPSWSPGTQNGRPVIVSFNLPIDFSLK